MRENTIESRMQRIEDQLNHGWLTDQQQLSALQQMIELKCEEQRSLPPSAPHMPAAWIRPFDTPGESETHVLAIER